MIQILMPIRAKRVAGDMRTIRNMVEHSQWANRRLLDGLITYRTVNVQTKQIIAHIVQSELVWLTRLKGNDSTGIELWPQLELTACVAISDANKAAYESFLAKIQKDDLDQKISYRNQTGKQYDTSISEILTHVALHSQYHRGQINILLREDGMEPVNVDMITYVREISCQ